MGISVLNKQICLASETVMSCVFCQIASRQKQEEILYEDDLVVAFLDRFRQPSVGGHILVIPREHFENIWTMPKELCAPLMEVAQIASKSVRDTVPCTGIRLWIASGRSAGQEILHLHVPGRKASPHRSGTFRIGKPHSSEDSGACQSVTLSSSLASTWPAPPIGPPASASCAT